MADPAGADSQPQQTSQPSTSDPSQQPSSTSNPDQPTSSSDTLTMNQDQELDAEIEPTPPAAAADSVNLEAAADAPAPTQEATDSQQQQQHQSNGIHPPHQTVLESRIPQKKDASLREFLGKMDDQYTPLIPDAVTDYYLTLAGLPPPPETDRRLARLLALATQKFVADVAADAYQYSRIRSTNTTSNNPLTGLGGAAGFGTMGGGGGGDEGGGAGKGGGGGKKDAGGGKAAPLGGPRAGYGGGGAGSAQGRTVLTMEDLGMAVGEYGVNVKRGEFYR